MRPAGKLVCFTTALVLTAVGISHAQSPATPSHIAVTRAIDKLTQTLNGPIPGGKEALPGWNSFFDSIKAELDAHAKATTFADRLTALNKLTGHANSLASVGWEPATEVQRALIAWLEPRVRVVTAIESLRGVIGAAAVSAEDATHRQGWVNFIDNYLGGALRAYESAATVQARQVALTQIDEALAALEKAAQWQPSVDVASAARSMLFRPNVDVTADPNSLAKYFARELIESGPVYRKGYVSQVTAGPYLGFGLFASDEGIGFYNSQAFSNYTPIHDFQQQMQADRRGQRITKLYAFSAASTDAPSLTVSSLITPSGLRLWSNYNHNVDALISSAKQPGHGLQRAVLGLVGFNQPKITQKVYENGITQIRENVVREAAAESAERMSAAEAEQNAKLANVLVGNRTAIIDKFLISSLDLRSRPEYALMGGRLGWNGAPLQLGADADQPPQFNLIEPGIVADVHLSSILANLVKGLWETPKVKEVNTLLVQTKVPVPGEPASKAVDVQTNKAFADFSKAVDAARAANNPKVQAIWLKKPSAAPSFGVDARGYLVVLIPDFQLDVPVPQQLAAAANNARILRMHAPLAELVLEVKVKPGKTPTDPLEFAGAVKEFNTGPGSRVIAINDDEAKGTQIDAFRSVIILRGFGRTLAAQPINIPLNGIKLPGYEIKSVSDLDPSGWLRVSLASSNEPAAPAAEAAPAAAPSPAPPVPSATVGDAAQPVAEKVAGE